MQTKHFLLTVIAISLLTNCVQGQQTSKVVDGKKILVVYYSWSEGKNTEAVAKQIQKTTGGDIFEITLAKDYPSDYQECVDQAKKEIAENYKPALKSKIENIGDYDVIFVGTPNWWSTIAPPVATFLSEYNLEGKTIIPFCTHGGGGKARCLSDIGKLCPKSTLLEGIAIPGNSAKSSQSEVDKWLKEIKVVK